MWVFYNDFLRDSLDCSAGDCVVKGNPKFNLSRGFIDFYKTLNRWSRLVFAGGADPILRLQVRATPLNFLKQLDLVLSDQRSTLPSGATDFHNIAWDIRRTQKFTLTGLFEGEAQPQPLFTAEGPWTLFEWLYDAEPGSEPFTLLPRYGQRTAIRLPNGNTEKYKVDIRTPDGRPFDLRSLTAPACVPAISK